ncbi:MAG: hypothetical protein OS112_05230 [Methanoregula sp.]|nr:MAG: hypothetical protein OS112_05230 [Methanoregula sp.]
MRAQAIAILFIILLSIAIPVSAADEKRYGYITVQDVTVQLRNDTAVINMNYNVDEGTRIIFFLLGKQDLKNKLYYILNYDGAQMRRVNLSSAEFYVDGAAYSYGKGIYWYPTHTFNVVIPSLTVQSPQITRTFFMTNSFPDGIGYFDTEPAVSVQEEPVS